MLSVNDHNISSPVRQIKGKAELYTSSAITKSGETITANNVEPLSHNVAAKVESKNVFDYETFLTARRWEKQEDGSFYNNGRCINEVCWTNEKGISGSMYLSVFYKWVSGSPIYFFINYTDGTRTAVLGSSSIDISKTDIFQKASCVTDANKTVNYITWTYGSGGYLYIKDLIFSFHNGEYAPYIGDVTAVEVTRCGKNIFNPSKLLNYGWAVDENGVYSGLSDYLRVYTDPQQGINNGYMSLEGLDTITISFCGRFAEGQTPNGLYFIVKYTDGTTSSIGVRNSVDTYYSQTFISNGSKKLSLLYFSYGNAGGMHYLHDIQIEVNTIATGYEPYKAETFTAATDGTVEGITSYAPTMNLLSNTAGALITATYKELSPADTFSYNDSLQSITLDRAGEGGKFFGFGVSQKLNLKLIDTERLINTTTKERIKVYFGTDQENYINNFPLFYITQTNRDENTNALSITAYDCIKEMERHTVTELELTSYTIKEFAAAAAALFGLSLDIQGVEDYTLFNLEFAAGANFDGAESIREALTAAAEATQTIFFVTENKLVFKRLSMLPAAALTIDKENYFSLDSGENRRLQSICSTNELGDAITASISSIGTTQFIRDNPFLELREDIADILDNAIAAVGGTTINQFSCSWRGNYLVEIGDKLGLITKDNETVYSYLLNDTITYNGAFSEETQWSYTDNDNETASNPTTLGDTLKNTFAKVDKANKRIDIVASEAAANGSAIAALQVNTESINASVTKTQASTAEAIEAVNENVNALKQEVNATISAESAKIEVIQEELQNGVSKVKTSMGYEFSDEGLIVDKTGAETNSKLNETGLTVSKDSQEMLFAGVKEENGTKKAGVFAEDLHATTYLIVGTNSRFEDYGSNRTGCFWIGG